MRKVIFSSFLFFFGIMFSSCSKDDNMMNNSPQDQFSMNPVDNEVSVRLDQKIEINFDKPMDRFVVENNFHLISQRDMTDSLCPYGNTMMHGDMDLSMMDSMKMHHLTEFHHTKGGFQWNSENTQCVFTPDSMLTPNMKYMVHFGTNMMNMIKERMGGMNMSGMNMENMRGGMMMMHFTTMDTISSGGNGHDGHH